MKGGQEITLTQFYRLFRKLQPKDEAQRKAFLHAVLQAMEEDLKRTMKEKEDG